MGVSRAGAHFGGDPDSLHDLALAGAGSERSCGVAADAVGTLGDVSDGDGDQLLRPGRQSAVGEYRMAERLECSERFWRQVLAPPG